MGPMLFIPQDHSNSNSSITADFERLPSFSGVNACSRVCGDHPVVSMETLVFSEARIGPAVHVSITISGAARPTGCLQRFHLRQITGQIRGTQQYGRGRRLLAVIELNKQLAVMFANLMSNYISGFT